ncbi:MAG: hypothetical protein ACLGG0_08670 [Bacteriovoracia bacterium]
MNKLWILLLSLSWSFLAHSQISLSFQLNIGEQRGTISLAEDGSVRLDGHNFDHTLMQSIHNSVQGLRVHQSSVYQAQRIITERILSQVNSRVEVKFDYRASQANPFIRKQSEENRVFQRNLSTNIFRPSFESELLKSQVSFDVSVPKEREALQLYRKANQAAYAQLGANDEYRQAVFAKQSIEIGQAYRAKLDEQDTDALVSLASGVLENNMTTVIESMKWLNRSLDFQKGFAVSIANNFNPASFLYPLDAHCSTSWCEAGELVGNATSVLIGAFEFMKGVALSSGGGALTLAAVSATGVSGGFSTLALPATAGATLAGIAMAGHGLGVAGNAFNNLFREAETPHNIKQADESEGFIKETGLTNDKKQELAKNSSYEVAKDFYRTLKDTGIESQNKKDLLRSFDLKTIKTRVLDEDIIVHRWHNNDVGSPSHGRFVSIDKIQNREEARRILALPESNQMIYLDSFILKKGTKVYEGVVSPLNNHAGGGRQIFIIGDVLEQLVRISQ